MTKITTRITLVIIVCSSLLAIFIMLSTSIDAERVVYQYDSVSDTYSVSWTPTQLEHLLDTYQSLSDSNSIHTNVNSNRTLSDEEIAQLNEQEAWAYCTNGLYNDYPTVTYNEAKSKLESLKANSSTNLKVNVWYWANPNDQSDMRKVTATKEFTVNSNIASLFEHAFEDIYNDPSKPVINVSDTGMAVWVIRSKTNGTSMSSHAIGTAVDINPSTGSFNVGGKWYGNGYKESVMTKDMWSQLPETHKKYHVLYEDCPIVRIFKSYGFYWGGDWTTTKDCMHLAFLGDGGGRATGVSNYNKYK